MRLSADVQALELQLLQRRPASHQEGAFPRGLLAPSEKVIFETRPKISGFLLVPLLITVPWTLLFAYAVAASAPNDSDPLFAAIFLVLLLVVPFWLWVYLRYLSWKGTAYALTDQRVIRRSGRGGRTLQDARYDFIQSIELSGDALKFRFAQPPGWGGQAHGGGLFRNQVVWKDLADAAQVQVFAQQWVGLAARKVQDEHVRRQLMAQAMANKVECTYCRTLVDVTHVRLDRPKCASCGAPLVRPV